MRKEVEPNTQMDAVISTGALEGDSNPKPTWTEIVASKQDGPRMKLSYHPPQIKEARVVVCPPPEVVEAGVSQWKDCVVGYFLDKQLPFSAVESIAFQIWKRFGIQKVMSNNQGFFFFKFSQVDGHEKVGSILPDTFDVECSNGLTTTIGVKYPWKPVKCLECHVFGHSKEQCGVKAKMSKPKAEWVRKEPVVAPDVCPLPLEESLGPQGPSEVRETVVIYEKSKSKQGEVCQTSIEAVHYSTPVKLASKVLSQSPIMRSDNSFSALALFKNKAGKVEIDETGAILTEEEILSLETVPTVEPDIVVFPATKRGRGKNKGLVDPPNTKKGVGGGTKK
ncbi:hypothetical protein RHGRI_029723 [Rhododendron griersonianum]|uniref:DUF4283 domain-containing protein n=1 Tax=Rhododendron griersonianum TaxID=479676 RepID=A0AAV6INX7_9ERIC|nr:hypothetical protein RHGRI_029723 [Rhododendron griersonianum]